jgi:hypothetical protein
VVDPDGRPVPGAFVMVTAGPAPVPEIALVTDADGRFGVRLQAGEWTLQARSEQGAGEAQAVVGPPPVSGTVEIIVR